MSSLNSILEAMATQIRETLEASSNLASIQVEPLWIPNPSPPTVDVYPGDPGRELVETAGFGATDADSASGEWVTVRARVATNDAQANQAILVDLCDPESDVSVVQALYDDPTLGGLAADLSLESQSGFRPIPTIDGGAFHLGVIWSFLVLPARS